MNWFIATVAVLLFDTSKPQATVVLVLYDVERWVHWTNDFPSGGSLSIAEPERRTIPTGDEFAREIQTRIAPGPWDGKSGWSIQCCNGLLIVRAPDRIHRMIVRLLQNVQGNP